MSKTWEIIGLVILIISLAFAFPDQTINLLKNRFYVLIGGILVFVVLFLVWLKLRTNY